jgi:hypothetical protein
LANEWIKLERTRSWSSQWGRIWRGSRIPKEEFKGYHWGGSLGSEDGNYARDNDVVDGFRPLWTATSVATADTTRKVAASTTVYMYRSMMWYKRGKGDGGM